MTNYLKLILLTLIFFIPMSYALIRTADTFETMAAAVKVADKTTLVLFDVDKVLVVPTDDFVFEDPIRAREFKRLIQKYPEEKLYCIVSDYFKKRTVQLLDDRTLGLLQTLKEQHTPVAALTQWQIGTFGTIPKMEEMRMKELEQVSISFAHSSPFKDQSFFTQFKDKSPMVKSGVILTGSLDKGTTLKAILEESKLSFKKIIFVDDKLDNLKLLDKTCKALRIEFHGIHYVLADKIPFPKFDSEKEQLRFKILETEKSWLTDIELDSRLNNKNKAYAPVDPV